MNFKILRNVFLAIAASREDQITRNALQTQLTSTFSKSTIETKVCSKLTIKTSERRRQNLFFNKVAGMRPATLLKKETLATSFWCFYCEL